MKKPIDNYEAFDQAFAIWYWLSHNYDGMFDPKYSAMNTLTSDHKLTNPPSIDFDTKEDLDNVDESLIIELYHAMNEENWEENFKNLCDYLENDFEKNSC